MVECDPSRIKTISITRKEFEILPHKSQKIRKTSGKTTPHTLEKSGFLLTSER